MMRRVLHITAWYPNALSAHEAPFIERHIAALARYVPCTVWHCDVRPGPEWKWMRRGPKADRSSLVTTPLRRWLIIEWLATINILFFWYTRDRKEEFDLINFHIAYPNCTRIRLLRRLMGKPMVITEHFSAYRFGYRTKSRGALRIKRIFHAHVPVIVVSRSLAGDIVRFSGARDLPVHVVDNAVDGTIFRPVEGVAREEGRFLMVAGWRSPKRPDVLLAALRKLLDQGRRAHLRLVGEGPDLPSLIARIAELDLRDHVNLLGPLNEQQVADEMRRAHALVHASDYETYSAVCAEALSCGTPVVASAVGGIPEFLSPEHGILVPENDPDVWASAWNEAWDKLPTMGNQASRYMQERAGAGAVGKKYHDILVGIYNEHTNTRR